MKYYIVVKRMSYDGEGPKCFEMFGADEEIIKLVMNCYGSAGFDIKICPEIKDEPSEQQLWREGKL